MKYYLLIIPIAILVTYSQLVVKWRALLHQETRVLSMSERLIKFVSDPHILSAYVVALIASFAWLFVITRLELSIAFPVYIGITFIMVTFGSVIFLSEVMTYSKFISVLLIFIGVAIGMASSD